MKRFALPRFSPLVLTATSLLALLPGTFAEDTNNLPLVPLPQTAERFEGEFKLRQTSEILADAPSQATGQFLAERLRKPTGFPLTVGEGGKGLAPKGAIILTTQGAAKDLGAEGYKLTVSPDSVLIQAPQQAGLFYGVQTLLQLLPPAAFSTQAVANVEWTAPCVQILDRPRFGWRGMMLDVSRHFFTKAEVESLLDAMATLKLNRFHWHLVDDNGWRIEIKKYPRLTEVGAWRKSIGFGLNPNTSTAYGPDGRYGGYYTQDDIREVVAYAAARHITIIPEIEMPGHSSAAIASYPRFSCNGGIRSTDPKAGVTGVFCAGNDGTYEFLENILSEVMTLFPSKYIHIGGDEVDKQYWKKCDKCQERMTQEGLHNERELQSYFIRRIEEFINSHGHTLIGWSEIREGGLAKNAVVMDWIGGAVEAASAGHDVVMSPEKYCYLDHYQSTNHATEPRAIGNYLPLSRVYAFEPVPTGLPAKFDSHILGAQGNLWTEYVASFKHVEYMAFPRMCALAEVTWSPAASRDWASFQRRLAAEETRFDEEKVSYRKGMKE